MSDLLRDRLDNLGFLGSGDAPLTAAIARPRRSYRFIWAAYEDLRMPRMSLVGELMRYGHAEWTGCASSEEPSDAIRRSRNDRELSAWAQAAVCNGAGASATPVVICNDARLLGEIVGSPRFRDERPGILVMGAARLSLPIRFGVRRHLDGRTLAEDGVETHLRAGLDALRSSQCSTSWLVIGMDALDAAAGPPELQPEAVLQAVAALGHLPAIRGVILHSSSDFHGACHLGIDPSCFALELGECFNGRGPDGRAPTVRAPCPETLDMNKSRAVVMPR